ncbi:MAG: CcoQ/FixQ family Cbb3-type cytochrome c oxidase assembly chaperone [Ginsengibacter sp.]|nr:CcoQ/FixQ family Cbb3-type cytochrome c oxidase assembly chaperone [Hanamia sp.]HZI69220.1 CcoQ/FixQ family Cbb3-type cytochrome c oxidase assembly chaperone [Hanamia sp.]
MYKFIQDVTENIKGAEIYPMISLLIFFLFFVVLLWFVLKMSKERIKTLSNIPLEDSEENSSNIF